MARATLKVDVTQKDIDRGLPLNARECPLAHAINRTLPESEAEVYLEYASVVHCDESLILPEVAKNFIVAFDLHELVKPFSFDLDIPEQALRGTWRSS